MANGIERGSVLERTKLAPQLAASLGCPHQMPLDLAPSRDEPLTLSVTRAVQLTGIGRSTLYKLMSENAFETRKIGKRRLISFPSLRTFLLG